MKIEKDYLDCLLLLIILEEGWDRCMGKKTRFFLFAFFSFFAYGLLVNLKNVDGNFLNEILVFVFTSIEGAVSGALLLVLSLLGLWVSLIAASLGQSLLVGGR